MGGRCPECGTRWGVGQEACPACDDRPRLLTDGGGEEDGTTTESVEVGGFVWACSECGREHQKNSPPCSRCGHVHLEKRKPDYSDIDVSGSASWLDALELKYAVGYLAVFGFVILVVLSFSGVISVFGIGGPSPPSAPGHANVYDNVSLQAVEDAYVDELNEFRAEDGAETLSVGSDLDSIATEYNRRRVRADVGDDSEPFIGEVIDRYEPDCGREFVFNPTTAPTVAVFEDAAGSEASRVAHELQLAPGDARSSLLADRHATIGIDVHVAPNDVVYLTVLVC